MKSTLFNKILLSISIALIVTAITLGFFILDRLLTTSQSHNGDKLSDLLAGGTALALDSKIVVDTSMLIYIEVAGAVIKPGLYSLPKGSRVGDLITKAGGISKYASFPYITKEFNLAKLLTDGEKIYLPWSWDVPLSYEVNTLSNVENVLIGSGTTSSISQTTNTNNSVPLLLNINTASTDDLDSLPGVGQSYLQKITLHRPYKNIQDFKDRSGLPLYVISKFESSIVF
jgi:competence protein ComEA